MKIAIAGASGLIGSALVPFFQAEGHQVMILKRDGQGLYHVPFEKVDLLINLAGETVSQRWTDRAMAKIKDSRVDTTSHLVEEVLKSSNPPSVFLNASAIGYYGNRDEQTVDESSSQGSGFLSEVAAAWEKALIPLQGKAIRTATLRFGVVLSDKGGALARMLTPFKLCLGGKIGTGEQFMSWIALDDVIGAINHVWMNDSLQGPINFVAPHPVRNEEFTKTLASCLNRPALFPMPAFAVKLIFGQMGEELLLSSTKVEPRKLVESRYPFLYPKLDQALKSIIGV